MHEQGHIHCIKSSASVTPTRNERSRENLQHGDGQQHKNVVDIYFALSTITAHQWSFAAQNPPHLAPKRRRRVLCGISKMAAATRRGWHVFLTSLPGPAALSAGSPAALLSLSPASSFLFSEPEKMKECIVIKHMLINARCTMSVTSM